MVLQAGSDVLADHSLHWCHFSNWHWKGVPNDICDRERQRRPTFLMDWWHIQGQPWCCNSEICPGGLGVSSSTFMLNTSIMWKNFLPHTQSWSRSSYDQYTWVMWCLELIIRKAPTNYTPPPKAYWRVDCLICTSLPPTLPLYNSESTRQRALWIEELVSHRPRVWTKHMQSTLSEPHSKSSWDVSSD